MKTLLKTSLACLLISPLALTSCGEDKGKADSSSSENGENGENGEKATPLSAEDAANEAFAAISSARAYGVDWNNYPEVTKFGKESDRLEKEYRAAIKSHPNLVELRKLQDEPGLESVERFRRIGAVSIAANKIPEIAAIGKNWHAAKLERIKAMSDAFEKEGKTDLAKTLKAIVARVR